MTDSARAIDAAAFATRPRLPRIPSTVNTTMAALIAAKAAVWKALMARRAIVRRGAGMTAVSGAVNASLQVGRRDAATTVILGGQRRSRAQLGACVLSPLAYRARARSNVSSTGTFTSRRLTWMVSHAWDSSAQRTFIRRGASTPSGPTAQSE